jgi:hypothetical protein
LYIPSPAPNSTIQRVAYYFAANNQRQYGDITFYSQHYVGNDTIYDTNYNVKSNVVEMFGFSNDSYQAMPLSFVVYRADNQTPTYVISDDGSGRPQYNG